MSTRRIAGKRAKFAGANFESQFENLCAIQGISVVRIPDSCRRVGAKKLIQIFSPFDYCICFEQQAAFIDTKTTETLNFTYSMINQNQVEQLLKLSPGGRAGYVVGLGNDHVYFVDVAILKEVGPRESVDFSRAVCLGHRIAFDCRKIFI